MAKIEFFYFFICLLIVSVRVELQLINFTQTLDHFGYYRSTIDRTFQQKVYVNDTLWSGAKAGGPIFVLFGREVVDNGDPGVYDLLNECANEFKAMLVHIEHRFYGGSVPLGKIELAMADHQVRGCLTTEQALQDFAIIIQSLKANFSAFESPVIVVGSGYGGALAAWFRVKYNNIAVGALASWSLMYLYGNNTPSDGFCDIISNDFEDVDKKCYQLIKKSWQKIDEIASRPNGLNQLSQAFNTCTPLQSADEAKNWLGQMYTNSAKYVGPANVNIKVICNEVRMGEDFGIEGVVTALQTELYKGERCFGSYLLEVESPYEPSSNITVAWAWQRCTELIIPIGCADETMLPSRPFVQAHFDEACRSRFGKVSRPQSPLTFYGRRDIMESFKLGGNIIFSNGLRDPFSSGGILDDISSTIIAIKTDQGSFSTDLRVVGYDNVPKWLKNQRDAELKIFRSWIDVFHHTPSSTSSRRINVYFLRFFLLATQPCGTCFEVGFM